MFSTLASDKITYIVDYYFFPKLISILFYFVEDFNALASRHSGYYPFRHFLISQ